MSDEQSLGFSTRIMLISRPRPDTHQHWC